MTSEILERLWAARLELLRGIAKHATEFKECDQCRSISLKRMGICPWCHCYRFKEDVEVVRATLNVMAKNPWPVNAGVVPRISLDAYTQEKPAPAPRTVSQSLRWG